MHDCSYILRKCGIAGIAAGALLALPLAAQVGLGLNPMRVDFQAVPGRAHSGSLALSNSTAAKVRVRVELLDLYVDRTMTPQFVAKAPAESEYSCRSWLSVNPMELELAPMTQRPVRYTVRVPADASERSFHCAIGFRTLPTVDHSSGTGMLTAVRMIAAIYPVVGKPSVVGEIKELKLEPVPHEPGILWRIVVVMENSGLMLYRPTGDVEVVDASGKVIESLTLPAFPALPKRQQRYLLQIKQKLSPGQYTLRARLDVGSEIQEASAVVTAEAQATAPERPAQ